MKVADLGIAAVIFVSPHLFGGRHNLGRFVIMALCVVTAMSWALGAYLDSKYKWRKTGGLGILLCAIGLTAIQLVPLPEEWIATLSPRTAEILPAWTDTGDSSHQLGEWRTLSYSPEDTELALATLVGYALLYITAVQRIETIHDLKRIIVWIASSAVIVAAFGIVQYFTANGKFFWIYEYPYTDTLRNLKAGFTNRNHFAHFLVLGLTCLIAWITLQRTSTGRHHRRSFQQSRSERGSPFINDYSRGLMSIAATGLVFAILASLCRGAVLAMVAAGLAMACGYAKAGLLGMKHIMAAGILCVATMAALSMTGDYDLVANRLSSLTSNSLDELDTGGGRRTVWAANLAAFKAGWLTGSGAGSHRFVCPLYLDEPSTGEFTHAENGYLQIATENGIGGIVLLALAAGTCFYSCVSAIRQADQNSQLAILAGGVLAALTASLVQSLVDFVWFIPACACVTILLAACGMRLSQLASPKLSEARTHMSRLPRLNLALGTSLAGMWILMSLYFPARASLEWDRYVMSDRVNQMSESSRALTGEVVVDNIAEAEQLNSESSLTSLIKVVQLYPDSARAHARLASGLLNRFEMFQQQSENQMTIGQIRDAAIASQFSSAKALRDWLGRAFGKNGQLLYQAHYHARRAVALCPLQGESYVPLACLSFLEGHDRSVSDAYYRQALLLRPQDPYVLFTAGQQFLIDGDIKKALELWARAYRSPGKYQYLINAILVPNMTASDFINAFQPMCQSLHNLWNNYLRKSNQEDMKVLLQYALYQAEQETATMAPHRAGIVWRNLACMQRDLGQRKEALHSLEKAYSANPDSFAIRYELAKCLASFQLYEQAEPHFHWCMNKSPNNKSLRAEFKAMSRSKMQQMARQTTFHNP